METPVAYSYIRMSTGKQILGDSLRRQLTLAEDYAKAQGLRLVASSSYRDIGVSAFKSKNFTEGALGQFLKAAKTGKVPKGAFLLVESIDRLSRDQLPKALALLLDILNAGITLVTLDNGAKYTADSLDMTGLIISLTVMSRAHNESAEKSRRIAAAWHAKRQAVDQGKRLTETRPNWLDVSASGNGFDVIKDRAKVIDRIFKETVNGFGVALIAKRLNEDGVPTWGETDGWRDSYIKKLLVNRALLGELALHTQTIGDKRTLVKTVPGYYPKVVSEELFSEAEKARISRRGAGGRKGRAVANLFAGICTCGYCGGKVHLKDGGAKNGKYLVCDHARRGLGCTTRGFPYPGLEQTFLKVISEVDIASLFSNNEQTNAIQSIQTTIATKESELLRKTALVDRLLNEFPEADEETLPMVSTRIKKFAADCEQLEQELGELRKELQQNSAKLFNAVEYRAEIMPLLSQLNDLTGEKREVLRTELQQRIRYLVSNITLYPAGRRKTENERLHIGKHVFELQREEMLPDAPAEYFDRLASETNRTYLIKFKSGRFVTVTPNPDVPEEAEFFIDTDQLIN